MRIFSDVGWNEDIVNNLDNVLVDTNLECEVVSTSTAEHAVEQTIKRMSQCVVGILERPEDTQTVLQAYLPWLGDIIQFQRHMNRGKVAKKNLTQTHEDDIKRVSQYESQVYNVANQLLDAQLASARDGNRI
jgi:hypothetical protein